MSLPPQRSDPPPFLSVLVQDLDTSTVSFLSPISLRPPPKSTHSSPSIFDAAIPPTHRPEGPLRQCSEPQFFPILRLSAFHFHPRTVSPARHRAGSFLCSRSADP